jgi:hypothetical protein
MNISSAQSSVLKPLLYAQPGEAPKPTDRAINNSIDHERNKDVTLSSEGQKASGSSLMNGIERYALPSWFSDFQPELSDLTFSSTAIKEGRKFVEMSDRLAADGSVSIKDQHAIQSYLDNMPTTQHRKNVESHYVQNKDLFAEFGAIHKNYREEAMAEHGIVTQEDWREKVLNAEGDNQALRFSIMQKMFDDPHAMELMTTLGIKRPSA